MKPPKREQEVIELFNCGRAPLTNRDIADAIGVSDISQITKQLVYYGYLQKTQDKRFTRTEKEYCLETRIEELESESSKSHEIVLNKVFTGSFLYHNLGHELINFMKDDQGNRYVYLNPWGNRGEDAEHETAYAFHIIESSLKSEEGMYEIIAASEISRDDAEDYYFRGKDNESRNNERVHAPLYRSHSFYEIFFCGPKTDLAHVYTYRASNLLLPNGRRIVVKIKSERAELDDTNPNFIKLSLMCNPQHDIAYADDKGKLSFDSTPNEFTDVDVLKDLLDLDKEYMRLATDADDINIDNLDDEQCFAVISDRTNLEDSTSNQIAYFLGRDKALTFDFVHNFLGLIDVEQNEEFEIFRENDNIDLLLLSDRHAIVIENKIDSCINGSLTINEHNKYDSQLNKYYEILHNPNDERFNQIQSNNKKFFILVPEYNPITREELDERYENGDKYALKTYNDLFEFVDAADYLPLGQNPTQLGEFMFKEFKKTIEYISWSKAQQRERTAYIRLKQRLLELDWH